MTQVSEKLFQGLENLFSVSADPQVDSQSSKPPVSEAGAFLSPALISPLRAFLAQTFSDPLQGLLRRAEFFAPRESSNKGLEENVEAVPLQSCTSLTLSTSTMTFGDVQVNSMVSQSFTISNPNCCAVQYYVSSPPYGFSVSSSGGTISPNGSVSISVTFNPTAVQNYSGFLNITPGSQSIALSGRGVRN